MSETSPEEAWNVKRIEELEAALRPFAGRVFNDNGDMTINTAPLNSEDLVRAYFVLKRKPKMGSK